MVSQTVKYTDYNGIEREETFYFHLTEAEVAEMEMRESGGLAESIMKVVKAKNAPAIIDIFKKLIFDSYGEKSTDGRSFVKSKELSTAFSHTKAYSTLFMELAFDAKKAAAFVNGIMPAENSLKFLNDNN